MTFNKFSEPLFFQPLTDKIVYGISVKLDLSINHAYRQQFACDLITKVLGRDACLR